MRILVVSPEAPTGSSNGLRLPLRQLLEGLAASPGVETALVAYRLADQPITELPGTHLMPRPEPDAASRLWELAAAILTRSPSTSRRLLHGLLPVVQRRIAAFSPDVVHVFSGQLAGLGPHLAGRPLVLTAMDAASRNLRARADVASGVRRMYLHDEERRYLRQQARTFPGWSRVVMVTEEDAQLVRAQAPGTRTVAIPNGVAAPVDSGERPYDGTGRIVLFHGSLSYAPNVLTVRHLVRDVWPRVHRQRPDARLLLVGRDPAPEVRQLAALPGVDLVGQVPDVWPWLWQADVYACPMTSGTGVKNKLLEAMAAGLPCVVTSLATQGLAVRDAEHVLVAEDAHGTAAHLVALLDNPGRRRQIGLAARKLVVQQHSWETFTNAYLDLYGAVIQEAKAR